MGNKTNLITLRPLNFFNSNRINFSEYILGFLFSSLLNKFLNKRRVFLANLKFYFFENKVFLIFFIFFKLACLHRLSKLKFRKRKKYKKKFKFKFVKIFKSLGILKKNIIIYNIINLNFFLKKSKKKISFLFHLLKRDGLKLFPRRFKFFIDFIQISILLIQRKISATFFIKIIAEIFRMVPKKMHMKFLNFIAKYFKTLIINSKTFIKKRKNKKKLKGIKFILNGKLKGKSRSKSYFFKYGNISIQTLKLNIDYAKTHVFTIYGTFGLKIWIY